MRIGNQAHQRTQEAFRHLWFENRRASRTSTQSNVSHAFQSPGTLQISALQRRWIIPSSILSAVIAVNHPRNHPYGPVYDPAAWHVSVSEVEQSVCKKENPRPDDVPHGIFRRYSGFLSSAVTHISNVPSKAVVFLSASRRRQSPQYPGAHVLHVQATKLTSTDDVSIPPLCPEPIRRQTQDRMKPCQKVVRRPKVIKMCCYRPFYYEEYILSFCVSVEQSKPTCHPIKAARCNNLQQHALELACRKTWLATWTGINSILDSCINLPAQRTPY